MVVRERAQRRVEGGGNYFASPKKGIAFVLSGAKTLDLALGGGWAENRIANIVGDKSSGKTLLCIEAAANFAVKYPKGIIKYREAEAAFDPPYAQALGMPLDRVDFGRDVPLETVEDLFEDLEDSVEKAKHPTLYICDSLDALSDRSEMDRDMDQGTYGAEKAKKMSQLFRRLTRKMAASKVTLIIVSQVRAKIGVTFGGRTTTRSGGRALDFYASQVLYLAQIGTVSKTVGGIKRPVAVKVKAKVDKNKVALPYREAEFQISFGFGVDDLLACLFWLKEARSLSEVGLSNSSPEKDLKEHARAIVALSDSEYQAELSKVHEVTERRWFEIETQFLPTRKKYGG